MKFQKSIVVAAIAIAFCFGSPVYGQEIGFDDLAQTENYSCNDNSETMSDNQMMNMLLQQVISLQKQVSALQQQVLKLSKEDNSCSTSEENKLEKTLNARLNARGDRELRRRGGPAQKKWLKPVWGVPYCNWGPNYYLPATVYYEFNKHDEAFTKSIAVEVKITVAEFKKIGGVVKD